jgi:hypothetical protein
LLYFPKKIIKIAASLSKEHELRMLYNRLLLGCLALREERLEDGENYTK